MLTDHDLAVSPRRRNVAATCTVALIRERLTQEECDVLDSWFADPRKTSVWILEVLRSEGYQIEYHSLIRHAAGRCKCGTH